MLSPAHCGGRRARQLLSPHADFELARRLRSDEGAPLGDVFAFVSGLYFRGKLAYARRFVAPPPIDARRGQIGVHIITATSGLRPPERRIGPAELISFAAESIDATNLGFTRPLTRSARTLRASIGFECAVVLLGSIATPKYVDVLLDVFGDRLLFPVGFVGRGDMSRGGLLLRQVDAGVELEYAPVRGAARRGTRPPRLPPLPRADRSGVAGVWSQE